MENNTSGNGENMRGTFVETAFTREQVERAIEMEGSLGMGSVDADEGDMSTGKRLMGFEGVDDRLAALFAGLQMRDARRLMIVLLVADEMGQWATAHYIGIRLGLGRAGSVVQHALELAASRFGVRYERFPSPYRNDRESGYRIVDWGVLDKDRIRGVLGL